jgi:hypothetical protein
MGSNPGWLSAGLLLCLVAGTVDAAAAPPVKVDRYYDRLLDDKELERGSAALLRVLRNTIYAKAGRTFNDPEVRAYFEGQLWYRPRPEGSAELSAVDEANLRAIKRWEAKRADQQAALGDATFRDLVIRAPPPNGEPAPRPGCEADARGVLADRKDEARLVALAQGLRWSGHFGHYKYGDIQWSSVNKQERAVRLACLPDLDGDGSPESVVAILYPERTGPDDVGGRYPLAETLDVAFLVSGKGPAWRAVTPLVVSGYQIGVEGHTSASVELVRFPDGRWALSLRSVIDACGEADCGSEVVERFTLKRGKLVREPGRPVR